MKNIHVLPTDKPSRLFMDDKTTNIYLSLENNLFKNGLNIYITSDEEIKEGDYVYDIFKNACPVIRQLKTEEEVLGVQETEFKIILTTDQDLIKDGVQDIDDEFLEWFVKNPSCEFVKVEKRYSDFTVDPFVGYKIIIPKEEPKPIHEQIIDVVGGEDRFRAIAGLKHKQEAIEEAFELSDVHKMYVGEEKRLIKKGFIARAKWQQEQDKKMYSEEEVIQILINYQHYLTTNEDRTADEWFEQFKKK